MSARGFSLPRWNIDVSAYYERAEASGVTMLRNARLGGYQILVGVAFGAAVLPLVPPTEAIGDAGWPVAIGLMVFALGVGAWMLRTPRMTASQHLAIVYLGLALVGVLTWLSGGVEVPFALFFAFTVQHVAAHPLRRAAPYLVLMSIIIALPLLYADADPPTEAFVAGLIPTLLALAASAGYAVNSIYGDAIARDIEDATARSEAEMARRRAESARAAATRLRELDQMKEGFVSTVSHELRSPLTSVKGYLEAMLEGEVGELNSEQREYAEIVYRNSTRLQALVDDLLVLSRIEAGKLVLEPERFDLITSLRAVLGRTRANTEGEPAIEFDGPERLDVTADRRRIEQALGNLISNALKFAAGSGDPVTVTVRGDGIAQVEVTDHGIGIPNAEIGRVGQRFFRASNASVVPGSGLGLAIARELLGRHHGALTVESAEGKGTRVRASWPREVED